MRIIDRQSLFPPELEQHRERLEKRIFDDALVYSILNLSQRTDLFYFKEDNQSKGNPAIFETDQLPDRIFVDEGLIYHVSADNSGFQPNDHTSNHVRKNLLYVTLPFPIDPFFQTEDQTVKQKLVNRLLHTRPMFADTQHQRLIDRFISRRRAKHRHNPLKRNHYQIARREDMTPTGRGDINPDNKPVAVIALHWLDTGGAESCGIDAIRAAKEKGYYTICVTDKRGKETHEEMVRDIADHTFCLNRLLPRPHWRRFYLSLFHYFDPEILHLHHCNTMYGALPMIKTFFPKTKVVSSTHIIEHRDGGYCRISGVFKNYIDMQHIISKELHDYYADQFGIADDNIRLGYLINKDHAHEFKPPRPHEEIAKELKILFVGRMVQQKRPFILVDLAYRLTQRKVNFSVTMAGSGPLKKMTERYCERAGLGSKINFLGNVAHADVLKLMEDHHIIVVPSENEGLTLIAYEAVLSGLTVISTEVGAQREIVADPLLVPRHTKACANQLVDKVTRLVKDKAFYDEMNAEQAEKAKAILASPNYADVLAEIYDQPAR